MSFSQRRHRMGQLPAGRHTKWLVLAAWVVLIMIAIPLAGRLSGAESQQATIELPRGADSTYVEGVADRFPDGRIATGLVVYVNRSGIAAADRAKVAADRAAFGTHAAGAVGEAVASSDGRALLVIVPLHNDDRTLPTDAGRIRSQAQGNLPSGLTARWPAPPAMRWMPATRRSKTRSR